MKPYSASIKGLVNGEPATITCNIDTRTPTHKQHNYETLEVVTEPYYRVSICGYMKNESGQINMSYGTDDGSDNLKLIFLVWDYFHLNDLKAGTKKQGEIIGCKMGYDEACILLEEHDLYIDRGYAYGNEWLTHLLTDEEIVYLKGLFKQV